MVIFELDTTLDDIVSINIYYFLMMFRITRTPMPPRKTVRKQNP